MSRRTQDLRGYAYPPTFLRLMPSSDSVDRAGAAGELPYGVRRGVVAADGIGPPPGTIRRESAAFLCLRAEAG
ncbi:hypothetical protein SBRY_110078 [Actinacidiphila bryophytorum]|uniref:Uncharacterized protein n=1 Tax=Actinacidiphila bryophytorum TaxID=1436133 RepID=A0A9W4GX62_9ACTN|nr:hypothetical protein SBRY_110078 [Actinacidiphila bryophytorum]